MRVFELMQVLGQTPANATIHLFCDDQEFRIVRDGIADDEVLAFHRDSDMLPSICIEVAKLPCPENEED